ncbi:LysR substrate-binding domain-containing protein [Maritimibacter dapengensis]|uniref:LysR family transcriptional regulator n=1 Tax=Maritimibacter dapengensis TaxID=2836868 RepID=A0ABS6SWU3_9RHOB|nr:LysR substrate-binding domain-containing protein [Maritimibacter dapengensis]MBV7377424.1 LysR family transcriptional regulator [Maritimibacter dapengensis]
MRLPPPNALRAFEAAARHEGFIGAADELHVTRGAISRHVKLLEDHLGTPLFSRHAKGVTLTEAGRRLQSVLTDAFGRIAAETSRIATDAADLRIICPPAMSIRWLLPRLDDFRSRNPDLRVRLTTDFHGRDGFDAIEYDVGFSVENWSRTAPTAMMPLFDIPLVPACTPSIAARLSAPSDMAGETLLHESESHRDWTDWQTAFAVPGLDPTAGDAFPNLDMATRAAVMGTGVVMADLTLCRDEIESGALVLPFPDMVTASPMGRGCLIGGADTWDTPKVRRFREWLGEVVAAEA